MAPLEFGRSQLYRKFEKVGRSPYHWVYLRDSFNGLNFYRNFKYDYLDYYLGITTDIDRVELQRLTKEKAKISQEIEFYKEMISSNESLELSKLLDEEFKSEATEYLQYYSELRDTLIKEEKRHLDLCNKQSLAISRKSVLYRINRNVANQRPELDQCPVCVQTLPSSLEEIYSHNQNVNDTSYEIKAVKEKVNELQSGINSSVKKISAYNEEIEKKYALLERYSKSNITFSSWLEQKSNIMLIQNIHQVIGEKTIELGVVEGKLSAFDVDKDVEKLRRIKSNKFEQIFGRNITKIGVRKTKELIYNDLYRLSSFPFQGVELLKTVMSYHFSLNELISQTENIHRFPFILDAVMKEDIDPQSRKSIFKFINESSPSDTQTIFSVSESSEFSESNKESLLNIDYVNKEYFDDKAKLIQIGDGVKERDLLKTHNGEHAEYIKSTLDIIYSN